VSVDRKQGRQSVRVKSPFIAALGGLVPRNLTAVRDDRGQDDGMVERTLPSFPEEFPPQVWTEAELSEQTEEVWANVVELLFAVPMHKGRIVGQPCPAPGLTNSFASTPAALSFSTTNSDCWSGTRGSASPWTISVRGSSAETWETGEIVSLRQGCMNPLG
jgi:hypothetical protein